MQTSLIINSTDTNGVAKAKAISNINSEATNEQLGEFAQKLTALTTNEYQGASRVIKMDITEEYSGGGGAISSKQIPTFVVGDRTGEYTYDKIFTYDGDGTLKAYPVNCYIRRLSGNEYVISHEGNCEAVVCASETDNYYSAWCPITIDGSGPY